MHIKVKRILPSIRLWVREPDGLWCASGHTTIIIDGREHTPGDHIICMGTRDEILRILQSVYGTLRHVSGRC